MIAGGGQLQVTQEPFSAVIVVDISDQLETMDISVFDIPTRMVYVSRLIVS